MPNLDPLTNGSYWGPIEGKDLILLEQTFLLSGYLQAIGFGVQFVVYVAVMRILWSRRHVSPVTHWALMIHSTSMSIASLLPVIGLAVSLVETFISNRNFPGGPAAYIGESAPLWFNVVCLVGLVAGNILADWLLLWRCHIIWSIRVNSSPLTDYVLVFPALLAVAAFGTGVAWNFFDTVPNAFVTSTFENLGIAYMSLSLALNFTLTGMIMIRMKSFQREISDCLSPEDAALYISISSMFVESAAVYTLVSIPLLVTIAVTTPFSQIFFALAPPTQVSSRELHLILASSTFIQICCSYFIIWRVAEGRALSGKHTQAIRQTPSHSFPFPQFRNTSSGIRTHDSSAALESQPDAQGETTINKNKLTSTPLAEITRNAAWEEQ